MRSISDIAIIVFVISVIAFGVLLEIYGLIVWAIPSGLFDSVLYSLGCLATDSFIVGFVTTKAAEYEND